MWLILTDYEVLRLNRENTMDKIKKRLLLVWLKNKSGTKLKFILFKY